MKSSDGRLWRINRHATSGRPGVRVAGPLALVMALVAAGVALVATPASAANTTSWGSFACSPSSLSGPGTSLCTAKVTNSTGNAPTGTITYSGPNIDFANPAAATCTVALVSGRTASCGVTVVFPKPGTATITAQFTLTGVSGTAGTSLLGANAKTANLTVASRTAPALYVPHSTSIGLVGDTFKIYEGGCPVGSYVGLYFSSVGDPSLSANYATAGKNFESPVAADGTWRLDATLDSHNVGTYYGRFYCTPTPLAGPEALTNGTATWVNALYTFTTS